MTKVKLRQKLISGNRQTLYLDFYPPIPHPETGKLTRREFLGMYIFDKPKKVVDKEYNKETLAIAESVRSKRQLEINAGTFDFLKKRMDDINFIAYFDALAQKQKSTNIDTWLSAGKLLKKFAGSEVQSSKVDESFCNDFREFLLNSKSKRNEQLSRNSCHSYFARFRVALKQGFKDGVLTHDLYEKIKPVKQDETNRQFLSMEELQALANTECSMPVLKKAALFSALTGLRFSDIQKLVWGEVHCNKQQGAFLQFRQQKTKGVEVLPISGQAYNLLGEKGPVGSKVFEGLVYSAYTNVHLKKWVLKAGITKEITFHSFRHTFATLQLSFGTDIYTVSKMLGHREIETTQIYAKIIDQTKRNAADKIKLDL
ncbi:site-specific integrase [Parafilimonas sp.]|uniref:site-specific integrase n=1 Tax=Parafilimonas sp. TaxID=1969739 RepID=UPI0039E52B7B